MCSLQGPCSNPIQGLRKCANLQLNITMRGECKIVCAQQYNLVGEMHRRVSSVSIYKRGLINTQHYHVFFWKALATIPKVACDKEGECKNAAVLPKLQLEYLQLQGKSRMPKICRERRKKVDLELCIVLSNCHCEMRRALSYPCAP